MAVTIRDVARRCGISVSAVSKVFNGYADISETTRRQVLDAARELGYTPNAQARALKASHSYNLGVLCADDNASGLTHPFLAPVLEAFKIEAERRGYDITFINRNIGMKTMSYLDHCRYRNVDGVLLACVDFYSPEVAELVNSEIPCVTIDHTFDNRSSILSDNMNGARMLVDRAVGLGHRRVAYIHGQRNSSVTMNRVRGFYRAMEAHGLKVLDSYVVQGRYNDFEAIRGRLLALLNRVDRPTCILLPDDSCYPGALEAIREMGLRVPEDISVAGYDGIPWLQAISPRLTTVKQDSETMGREAALRLMDHIDHPNTAVSESTLVPAALVEGESLGAVPEGV